MNTEKNHSLFADMLSNFQSLRAKKKCTRTANVRVGKNINKVKIISTTESFTSKMFYTSTDDYIGIRMRKIKQMINCAEYLGGTELRKKIVKAIMSNATNKRALQLFEAEENSAENCSARSNRDNKKKVKRNENGRKRSAK